MWEGMCRIRHVDPQVRQVLAAAKSSGCLCLFSGVETFQQGVLDKLGKSMDIRGITPWLSALKDSGIGTAINLIVGLPGQTADDVKRDLDEVERLIVSGIVDSCGVTFLVLYPGTRFAEQSERYGIVHHDMALERLEGDVQHSTAELDQESIRRLYQEALARVELALRSRLSEID